MKRKTKITRKRQRQETERVDASEPLPDWLNAADLTGEPLEPELDADDLAADAEKGIRDLPVWKNLVARVGLQEARKILRRGMLVTRITDGNPRN